MSGRRTVVTVVAAAVWAAIALPVVPSYAANPVTDLYVGASGSDSNNDCATIESPCATVQYAVDQADASGTTIHVGAGTFDGPIRPGALGMSLNIDGVSPADTILTNSGLDGFVVEADTATTGLSNLTARGGLASTVLVDGGGLAADHVVLETAGCVLGVLAGSATVTDSTLQGGGYGGASCDVAATSDPMVGDVAISDGSVRLVRTQVLRPDQGRPGVKVKGGTFTADESYFDDAANDLDTNNSDGLRVSGGTASVRRSAFHGFGSSGVHTLGGTALLTDDTFDGNVVGATNGTGSLTAVRSTFQAAELASLQGDISLAGSVLETDSIGNCANGTVTDLGYNLATDDTCGLTAATSHEGVAGLNLDTGIADRGGPVPTVAILNPSAAVDTIPVGATYGDPATPLCPVTDATDLRGVPRPAGGACDAGSMEMAATATVVDGPAKAAPHAATTFDAEVGVPASTDVDGLGLPVGTVTFTSGDQGLCLAVPVSSSGEAQCTTSALGVGLRSVVATFAPGSGSTLHASTSAPVTTKVGTVPVITAPGRVVVHVGTKVSIVLRASGKPAPVLRLRKGHLPRGLRFHRGTGRATITGTPKRSAVGRYHLRVRATNPMGSDVHALTLVVRRR
jgi:hypothetical protein